MEFLPELLGLVASLILGFAAGYLLKRERLTPDPPFEPPVRGDRSPHPHEYGVALADGYMRCYHCNKKRPWAPETLK